MNESIKSSIKSLPPLPESVAQIQRICAMPDASLADLSAVVEKDPMITANLLRAANSPFYGFSREIKNVQQAVSLFGMATVKGLALSGAIKNVLKIDLSPYSMTQNDFANISQAHFSFVNSWIKVVSRPALDILAPSAFLHLTGSVVIAQELIAQNKSAEFTAILAEDKNFCDAEMAVLEVNTPAITAEIFEHWRFDVSMIEAIRASANPSEASSEQKFNASVLATARIAFPLGVKAGDETFKAAAEFAGKFNFDAKLVLAAAEETLEKLNA